MAHLQLIGQPTYICVSREMHEDGSPHLHAIVAFEKKLDRSGSIFNLPNFNANIQPSLRSVERSVAYVKKHDDFLEFGEAPTKKGPWVKVCNAVTREEFWSTVSELSPRDVVLNLEKLEYFAEKKFKPSVCDREAPIDLQDWILPEDLKKWYEEEFKGTHRRRKSLVLYGPTRLGKTEWARSLGKHMYFNALANFKEKWTDEVEYVIFDDFGIEFIPNRKGFFGGQEEFEISGKYMKVKSVKWGKVCIYLCNNKPDYGNDKVWFEGNVIECELVNKLY